MTRARGNGAADEVWILLVETTRAEDDGLPEGASGAALLCLTPAKTEQQAVDETVRVLREAGMAPIEVTSYGTISESEIELDDEQRALADRALMEDAVVVAGVEVFRDDDEEEEENEGEDEDRFGAGDHEPD